MPNQINLDSGAQRIMVDNDPERVVVFYPTDILFAKKYYAMKERFDEKHKEYQEDIKELEKIEGNGNYKEPEDMPKTFARMEELCDWIFSEFDILFGEGTADKVFRGVKSFDLITRFIEATMPLIEDERKSKVDKYVKS